MSGRTQAAGHHSRAPACRLACLPCARDAASVSGHAAERHQVGAAVRRGTYAAALEAYRDATARVEQQAATRKAGTWAVILDADETVISNLQYQIERIGQGYSAGELGGVGP